jgi:glycosyltransferase involved in cell wall biosynthesis
MMRVGLPAISTRGPEIAGDLENHSAGWLIEARNSEALARVLVEAISDPLELKRRAGQSRALFEREYTLSVATAPLIQWVKNPTLAPDRGKPPLLLPLPSSPPGKVAWWQRLLGK